MRTTETTRFFRTRRAAVASATAIALAVGAMASGTMTANASEVMFADAPVGALHTYLSDAGVMPHENVGGQFRGMVEYGMTPIEAIRAATVNAADALGQAGQVGVVKPGAWGDLIAVDGDPLTDVGQFTHVDAVIKGGKRVD